MERLPPKRNHMPKTKTDFSRICSRISEMRNWEDVYRVMIGRARLSDPDWRPIKSSVTNLNPSCCIRSLMAVLATASQAKCKSSRPSSSRTKPSACNRTRTSLKPSAARKSSASSMLRSRSDVTDWPYAIRLAKHGEAGLSATDNWK